MNIETYVFEDCACGQLDSGCGFTYNWGFLSGKLIITIMWGD